MEVSNAFTSNRNAALFILEAGVNHEGSLDNALKLVRLAAESGADFIKFQTYTAENLAAPTSPAYWNLTEEPTTSQFELFSKYDGFTESDYVAIARQCEVEGIGFLTTCFDENWLNLLDPLMSIHKVASADITNLRLLQSVASKGKPILLSTGAATFDEIDNAIKTIHKDSNVEICLLHCVLNYPTEYSNANISRLLELQSRFANFTLGYSDHTRPNFSRDAISAAFVLGSRVFEKHFTFDKSLQGNDHYHSFDYKDVQASLQQLKVLDQMLTFTEDQFLSIQRDARLNARRGLYAKKDLSKGHIIQAEDLIALRPTLGPSGFAADEVPDLINQRLERPHQAFEPILRDSIR